MKRNGFVVLVLAEMTIFILTIRGNRLVISTTPKVTEKNGPYTASVCEYDEVGLRICCKEDERLDVAYASYGRNNKQHEPANCRDDWPCSSKTTTLSIVKRLCSGLSNCTVRADSSIFGDPCADTKKYLAVIYWCYPGNTTVPPDTMSDADLFKYPAVTHQCIPVPTDDETTPDADLITSSMTTSSTITSSIITSSIITSSIITSTMIMSSMNRESPTSPYNGPFCPAEEHRNVSWTATRPVSTANSPCPNNIDLTKAKRLCRSKAVWSSFVDLSECVSPKILSLKDKLDSLTRNFSLILVRELVNGLEEKVSTGDDLYGGDLEVLAKLMVGAIALTENNGMMDSSDVDRILETVVNTTSMLLEPKNIKSWKDLPKTKQSSTATRLLWSVESSSALRANSISEAQHFNITDPGLDVLVYVMKRENFSTFFNTHDKVDYLDHRDILQEGGNGLGRVTVALFDDVARWLHVNESATKYPDMNSAECDCSSDASRNMIVNTRVMSISIVPWPEKLSRLKENVRLSLKHKEKKSNESKPICAFWKYSKETFEGHWSEEGCRDVSNCSYCTYTICECDHLTNFAVLMSVSGVKMSEIAEHAFALSVITYIGCIISIICLALAFITFYSFKDLRCVRNTIHKNLVLCLFISEVIFLLGIGQNEHKRLCAVVAGFLHYFFLTSFSWMFLEGVQLYILLVEVFEAKHFRFRWYYIGAYGVPALVVLISAGTTYAQGSRYAAEDYCWLTTDNGLVWAFTGPVAVIICVNSVVLGVAIYTMHTSKASSLRLKHKSKTETIGSWVRGVFVLMILLGSTWVFGFFYVNKDSLFMAYIFTILNSLQGLFIFVFHCLTFEKVQKEYRRCIQRCTWLPEYVRVKYGGLNVTSFPSRNNPTESLGMPSSDCLDDHDKTTDIDAIHTQVEEKKFNDGNLAQISTVEEPPLLLTTTS